MPTVDAQIPLSVRPWQTPDYQQSLGNALSLKSAITQNQQQDQQIQQQQALRDIWKDSDTSTPQGQAALIKKVGGVNPSLVPALQKQFGDQAVQQSTIAKNNAQATEATEKTADLKAKRVADAYTAAYNEVKSDLDEYDQATKDGRLTAQVTDKITADMKALAPQFESFGIFPAEMIEKMKNGQFNEQNWRKSLPQLKAHADQATLIAQQKADAETKRVDQQGTQPDNFEKEAAALYGKDTPGYKQALAKHISRMDAPTSIMMGGGTTGVTLGNKDLAGADFLKTQPPGRQAEIKAIAEGRAPLPPLSSRNPEAQAIREGVFKYNPTYSAADFTGAQAGARTAGTRGAQLAIVGEELKNFVPQAEEALSKVTRTGFTPLNKIIEMGTEKWSPEQADFVAVNQSIINVYAQLASRGVSTVHSQQEAAKMLNTAATPAQYKAVLNRLTKEADSAIAATSEAKEDVKPGGSKGSSDGGSKTVHWDDLQ